MTKARRNTVESEDVLENSKTSVSSSGKIVEAQSNKTLKN